MAGGRTVSSCALDAAGFFAFARATIDACRLREEAGYVQHGTTSTLLHSIAVAYKADELAHRWGCLSHLAEIRRAALLHDYYLYDWHDASSAARMHGFAHPGVALRNARADFADLTRREANAIACHMFPLTPVPPRSAVGWVLTVADKLCAAYETGVRRGTAYPELRLLCAHYLPGVELCSFGFEPGALPVFAAAPEGVAP